MNHDRYVQTDQEGSREIDADADADADNNVPPVDLTPQEHISNHDESQHTNFQPRQQQLQPAPMLQPFWPAPPSPLLHSSPPGVSIPANPALLHYYEAQMRDHAAAYASAAAAAAMTAAQIAANLASSAVPNLNHPYHNNVHMTPMPMSSPPHVYPQHLMRNSISPYGSSTPISSHPLQPLESGENENMEDANDRPCHPEDENRSNSHHHNHRRRKQQRRMPPSNYNNNNHTNNKYNVQRETFSDSHQQYSNRIDAASASTATYSCGNNWSQQGQQKRGRRRRSASSDSGNNDDKFNRNRRRNRKIALTASSSSDGGSSSCITKKKQRQPNDESLLGKTGASALYEWCGKRRTVPMFSMKPIINYHYKGDDTDYSSENHKQHQESEQDFQQNHTKAKAEDGKLGRLEFDDELFEMTVSIDGVEMGTGRGLTKASAKHETSRRALQVLLPGVQFDENSGILIHLPGILATKSQLKKLKAGVVTSLEDLAPNLAKQLAIGHNNNDDHDKKSEVKDEIERNNSRLTDRDSRKRQQKWPHIYPGTTSTTSDDEDENSYYASRGASVCSSLLHAMVQIDERLTEPPEYTYQVLTITNGEHSKLKRKAGIPIKDTSTTFPRGSFECTGILKLRINANATETDDTDVDSVDGSTPQSCECYQVLRSFGVGGTKREARHTAAAKLLAMLFPDYVGMAEVKQAAEAAREKYATRRDMKQQSKRGEKFRSTFQSKSKFSAIIQDDNEVTASNFILESLCKKQTEVPDSIKLGILSSLDDVSTNVSSKCDLHFNDNIVASKVRQLSRQQQLEENIDAALQKLNEHDEDGRSLPEELTVDDVGRTVIRRARVDDIYWVNKLFGTQKSPYVHDSIDLSPLSVIVSASDKEPFSVPLRLWSSSTIVLLLCRAFHEDPPLGCAVLTLGFSMQKGKILRIAQIASKPHQPRERFIETLSDFSKYMGCFLISSSPKSSYKTLRKDSIQKILNPKLESMNQPLQLKEEVRHRYEIHRDKNRELASPLDETLVNKTSLQSVQEEDEGVEESDASTQNNELKGKRRDKPSKRSRVE
mmetsp:Transcript_33902/g.38739  ORF Transcript_33902/g.38739 Transcript_33902/m.38739 type:complete len:1056 (+) Transcript_33902:61-3228(+)